jgi:hypothetical protein
MEINAPGRWIRRKDPQYPDRFARQGEFGVHVEDYTGPKDGKSHPVFPRLMKTLNHHMVLAEYREVLEGSFPKPSDGTFVYASSHPTYFDPILVADVIPSKKLRFVANERAFDGARGTYMTLGGAFPVDMDWGRITTIRHAIDNVQRGNDFVIYPEGKISKDFKSIERHKRGAAAIARLGGARGIVPLAVHYRPDDQPRTRERLAGAAVALSCGLAVAGLGRLGAVPALLAGGLGAGLAGAFVGGKIARKTDPKAKLSNYCEPFDRYFAGLSGLVKGGLAGAATGAVLATLAPGSLGCLGLLGAAGALGFSEALASRPLALVQVGEPILLEDHHDPNLTAKQNDIKVTEALHQSIGELKARLTGVPYDPMAPKVFDLREKPIYEVESHLPV